MSYKFKIGDFVICSDKAKSYDWYHKKTMKIVSITGVPNKEEYYTDYWGHADPVDPDYLTLDKNHLRNLKLMKINENLNEDNLNDFMEWLTDVWNPNQLYIPFQSDAAKAYLNYLKEKKYE